MITYFLPFKPAELESPLCEELHQKQLLILSKIGNREFEALCRRDDFLKMLKSFFSNRSKRHAQLIINIVLKLDADWDILIETLVFLAYNRLMDTFNLVWKEKISSCPEMKKKFILLSKRLANQDYSSHFSSIYTILYWISIIDRDVEYHDPISTELMNDFPGLQYKQATDILVDTNWSYDKAVLKVKNTYPHIADSLTLLELRQATLKAAKRLEIEEEQALNEEALPVSFDPAQWLTIHQVPPEYFPLMSAFLKNRPIFTNTHRKHHMRLALEKDLKMSAEQIEGFASLLVRNPRCAYILQEFQSSLSKHK